MSDAQSPREEAQGAATEAHSVPPEVSAALGLLPEIAAVLASGKGRLTLHASHVDITLDDDAGRALQANSSPVPLVQILRAVETALEAAINSDDGFAIELARAKATTPAAQGAIYKAWKTLSEQAAERLLGEQGRVRAEFQASIARDGFAGFSWATGWRSLQSAGKDVRHPFATLYINRFGRHRKIPRPFRELLGDVTAPEPYVLEVDADDIAMMIRELTRLQQKLSQATGQ